MQNTSYHYHKTSAIEFFKCTNKISQPPYSVHCANSKLYPLLYSNPEVTSLGAELLAALKILCHSMNLLALLAVVPRRHMRLVFID